MPKVEVRKARKDYPNSGIKAGDTYYYTKLKLQRGGQIKRSLKPFKPSQLTNSPFKSGWLAMQEDWEDSDKGGDAIRAAAEALTSLGEEARGSFDNMPEGLQQGETGQQLEARADACENAASELESLADEFEALEEPGEEPEEPGDEPALGDPAFDHDSDEAMAEYEAAQEAYDAWQTTKDEYDSEVERLQGEADTLIGEMPE